MKDDCRGRGGGEEGEDTSEGLPVPGSASYLPIIGAIPLLPNYMKPAQWGDPTYCM